MREGIVEILDELNIEFVHLLASLGVQRNVSNIFTFWQLLGNPHQERSSEELICYRPRLVSP
jgi:hypothetical protein